MSDAQYIAEQAALEAAMNAPPLTDAQVGWLLLAIIFGCALVVLVLAGALD